MSLDPRSSVIVHSQALAARRPAKLTGRGRWFIEQRLRFIESRLFWIGFINRRDLVEHFQITPAIASSDLAEYQALAKGNAVYDKNAKVYRAGREFRPLFPNPSLSALHAHALLQDGTAPLDSLSRIPPVVERVADPVVARNLASACRDGFALRIHYHSMAHPKGDWRWIEPRFLVTDGIRWHVRAWCRSREDFRDFVLSRIDRADEPAPSTAAERRDVDWEMIDEVILQAHPSLSAAQRALVERDHQMQDGRLVLPCRRALLWYVLRNLGLDIEDGPPRQLLSLVDSGVRLLAGFDSVKPDPG